MKIIGGKYRNRNIFMPEGIRPTNHLVRKAVFDILGHDMSGEIFVDFCSGSGAVGFEALSLGAEHVVCVEKDPRNVRVMEENLVLLRGEEGIQRGDEAGGTCEFVCLDMFAAIKDFSAKKREFDLLFIDPPYGRGLAKKALKTLGCHVIFNATSTVVIQSERDERMPDQQDQLKLVKHKTYGATQLNIYQPVA